MSFLLLVLILLPVVVAALCLVVPTSQAKNVAFVGSCVELGLSLALIGVGLGGTPIAEYAPPGLAVENLGFGLRLGCDPISYWLVLLTTALMPLVVFGSYGSVTKGEKGYYFWLMLLVAPMVGTFLARDAILFYIFFELTLVPMFFLIGIWGGVDKEFAAKKFFLYTFVGGVFTLAGLIYVGVGAGTFEMSEMARWAQANVTDPTTKVLLFVALLAGIAVKIPLFPVHTWLPLAHTVAPTAGSVVLAGVLLKLGTYGLLRIVLPIGLLSTDGLMPVMANSVIPFIAILAIIGVIYGALIAWVQEDVKKLVAYSSVSHLGFCVLGLIALNDWGMQGSVFYMINHGISTGALFLMIGMIYDRYHTRMFADYGGLGRVMPIFSFFLVLFTMSSIGLPGTNGFVSEFLTILGAFTSEHLGPIYGATAAIGVILGAVYMLHMVARLIFGPLKLPAVHADSHHAATTAHAFAHQDEGHPPAGTQEDVSQGINPHAHHPHHAAHAQTATDLNGREIAILTPLAIAVIVLGVYPTPLLKSILPGVQDARTPVMEQITTSTAGAVSAE